MGKSHPEWGREKSLPGGQCGCYEHWVGRGTDFRGQGGSSPMTEERGRDEAGQESGPRSLRACRPG